VKTERHGSRIKKIHDKPKTLYKRVLDTPHVAEACKKKLRCAHAKLDVVAVKQEWDRQWTALKPTPQW
jgi:hypothetical protein